MASFTTQTDDFCVICHVDKKIDPVTLECGHSYCCNCIVELLSHTAARAIEDQLREQTNNNHNSQTPQHAEDDVGGRMTNEVANMRSAEDTWRATCPLCRKPVQVRNISSQSNEINSR